jgi:hypothetical protein
LVELDLVTLDREKLIRTLTACGVDPRVISIFEEIHDTTRATQKLVEQLMEQHAQIIQALQIVNKGFSVYGPRLQELERKFGNQNVKDVISTEKLDG